MSKDKPEQSTDKEWITKNDSLAKFGFDIEKDVRSVGVYTTIRFAMEDYASMCVKKACKEQREICAQQFWDKNRDYAIMTMGDKADLCINAPSPDQ